MQIFSKEQQAIAERIMELNHTAPLHKADTLRVAVGWAYYSAKIEQNMYDFVDAVLLLKEGITAPAGLYHDAVMLKNLFNTFIYEVDYILAGNKEEINERLLYKLHGAIAKELVSDEDKGRIRRQSVAITGTTYKPLSVPLLIQQQLSTILYEQAQIESPLERAVFLHCNLARLQPFIDGNKRTARMVESITLMNADIEPIYSDKDEDIEAYRKALLHFYETEDYAPYTDYLLGIKLRQLEHFNK